MSESRNTGDKRDDAQVSDPPVWFLDNCVKTASQLSNQATRVVVRDGNNPDVGNAYIVDTSIYKDLQDFIEKSNGDSTTTLQQGCRFTKEALLLHFPEREIKDNGDVYDFLAAVVEKFSVDAGADLVYLCANDMTELSKAIKPLKADSARDGKSANDKDLDVSEKKDYIDNKKQDSEDEKGAGRETKNWFDGCLTGLSGIETDSLEDQALLNDWIASQYFLETNGTMSQESLSDWLLDWAVWEPDEVNSEKTSERNDKFVGNTARVVQGILQSLRIARNRMTPGALRKQPLEKDEPPLVIVISDIDHFFDGDKKGWRFKQLQTALKMKINRPGKHIVIGTSGSPPIEGCDCSKCRPVNKLFSSAAQCQICPTRSKKQESLFENERLRYRMDKNIRELQKEVLTLVPDSESALLVPYATWELPAGTQAGDLLRSRLLSDIERRKLANRLSKDLSVDHFKTLIQQMEQKSHIEKTWQDATDLELKVPTHAVQVVKLIKGDKDRFHLENRLLQCIVDPSKYPRV
jgi:hypothetical protein